MTLKTLIAVAMLSGVACSPTDELGHGDASSRGGGGGGGQDGGGGSPASITEDFCVAMDDCNNLSGISIPECVDMFDECLDSLLYSERQDWEYEIVQCMELPTCGGFIDCYWDDVPYC